MTELLDDFRPIGGSGNNLVDSALDATAGSPELRIAPANFAAGTTDGLVDGPNPRTLSNVVSGGPNALTADPSASAWLYTFGQFLDHDLDLESVTGTADISISIPAGDPDLAETSISMTRAVTDPTTGTVVNTIAANLDLSQVYGSDTTTAASLRNADGTMKTSDDGKALSIVDGQFVAGDARVMENPELTAITTMFVEEHNHWVGVLKTQNPTWTGDELYDQAKAITTAEYQQVIYNEYLPTLIGKDTVGTYTGYDPTVNSQITQEFSTVAFRVGHSQVSGDQVGISNDGTETFSESLADSFFNTPTQTEANGIDDLIRNMSSEFSQATDVYAVDELRNLLSASPAQLDLIAIDIQRERDLGIGTLNQTREALGLTPYTSFADLTSDTTVQATLESQFGTIDNVDLFLGGLAENHVSDGVVGETFQAIIGQQFTALRNGDRYYWENQNFDTETAKTISQTTLATIIERTTGTPAEQPNVFIAAQRHASDVAAEDPNAAQLVIGVDTAHATIAGGTADDTIVAGLGRHQFLTGGGGSDVFQFDGSGHKDTITDWNSDDVIQFQPTDLTQLMSSASVSLKDINGGTLVKFDGNSIFLRGVQSICLTADNFLYPAGTDVSLVRGSDSTHSVIASSTPA